MSGSWPGRPAYGTRLVADVVAASQALPTAPTAFLWANVRAADSQYDAATGVITIARDCFFTSVANWTVNIPAGQSDFFADAEFFVAGAWTRGTNSGRREEIRTLDGDRTVSFGFSGWFAAGTKLRFVAWASSASATIATSTDQGTTVPAARLTYSTQAGYLV